MSRALILCLLLPLAHAMNSDAAPHHTMTLAVAGTSVNEFSQYEKNFQRSADAHRQSMDAISKTLTLPSAMELLKHSSNDAFTKVTGLLSGKQNLRTSKNDGFGGIDGARRLLNDMIHESMTKYDAEIAKCTDYYAKQCALMEVARGQISAANFIAANSRALILDAQAVINQMEKDIPATKKELADHNRQCKTQLHKMNEKLKVLMGDVAVMTMILKMSDCDAKGFVQMHKLNMLHCTDECTKKETVTFDHDELQHQVTQIKSQSSRDLIAETFADLFNGENSAEESFLQNTSSLVQEVGAGVSVCADKEGADCTCTGNVYFGKKHLKGKPGAGPLTPFDVMIKGKYKMKKNVKGSIGCNAESFGGDPTPGFYKYCLCESAGKTKFNRPPVPRTKVPSNPCTDPNKGAPSAEDKRAAKCTLKKSPQCYKLQGRFLQIQAGITDDLDKVMDQISKLEADCKEIKKSLESSIETDGSMLSSSQTKLAAATEKESTAGETGRQVAKENEAYNNDLVKQMKTCSTNYINFETELCALRKIRGDLFKKMVKGHKGFFQDCEVTSWVPEACTKVCAGGEQKIGRAVMTHPSGGAKCLPLAAEKKCNRGPCPVNCKLETWSGWSKCSSKCGGGLATRVRDVLTPMQYDGKPCGATSQAKQCNVEACEKDCVLHPWTKFTGCSKDCDGGSRKRVRMIKEPAEGAGKCASQWSPARLQYRRCAQHRCMVDTPGTVLKCNQSLDIVLVMDGTPKTGKSGWTAEVTAANQFIDAFTGAGSTAKPNFAVIHYTGPRTWSGVSKCTGKSTAKVDMEKTCKIKIASHFEEDMKKVKGVINGLEYAPGSKLLSLGLMTVQAEMALGRATKRSIVVVFMDGEPLSYRKTMLASHTIRKKARLLYVVVAKFAPLASVKKWVSRRWKENLVKVETAADWAKPETGTHVIANICPKKNPKLKMKLT